MFIHFISNRKKKTTNKKETRLRPTQHRWTPASSTANSFKVRARVSNLTICSCDDAGASGLFFWGLPLQKQWKNMCHKHLKSKLEFSWYLPLNSFFVSFCWMDYGKSNPLRIFCHPNKRLGNSNLQLLQLVNFNQKGGTPWVDFPFMDPLSKGLPTWGIISGLVSG